MKHRLSGHALVPKFLAPKFLVPKTLGAVGLIAAMGVASAASAQTSSSAPFSVRDVMSASFASGLVASPTGDRIAWIEKLEGERSIWVAEGPGWEGRQLTSYEGDNGQELASLTFTSDGDRLLFVRGGAPNGQGEVPDPLSTPDDEGRAVWMISSDGGAPVHVTDAGGFALAPGGLRIAFRSDRDIMTLELSGDAEPERLARVSGSTSALTWSPDGTRLAFVSGRGDHAFIGVLNADADAITYLDPSLGLDGSPVWSPDGRRIAFLRIPNVMVVHLFAPRREALPFSIHVADATTGDAQEVWRAREGVGSAFSGVNASNQLMWGDGDRVVFPWEGDGWRHLYSVPAGGGTARLLTPGTFEVQFASLSPDAESIVYDSGQDDIDRKHVWRVRVSGGVPELLTPGTGLEWGAVVTGRGTVAFHASSAIEPSHTEVIVGGDRKSVGPELSDRFPMDQLVVPQQVVFSASDGMQIHGQLFIPKDHQPGQRHPAALFFHGGSRRQMLLGFHHRSYYHNAYAFNQALAAAGYVVLSVNYRSGVGYGMEFREAENYGATGASEFADVVGAGSTCRAEKMSIRIVSACGVDPTVAI